jgi:REP-associated tyrosine transposase
MPRPLRVQLAGGTYHITAQGCAERAIFLDRSDRTSFENILDDMVRRQQWCCQSICLMTTHFHLLVTTPEADLATGMQRLNGLYAQSFNRRQGTKGHLFSERYHAEFIQSDSHLLETCRYIALNPVRAGLCRRPADWVWSSYAEALGLRSPRRFIDSASLLRLFGENLELARSRYQIFVEDGLDLSSHAPIRLAS